MKNPYAPGFWCAVVALVLLSATYFYGVMLAHQIDKAPGLSRQRYGVDRGDVHCRGGLGQLPGAAGEETPIVPEQDPGAGLGTPKLPCAGSKPSSTGYFWGSYWQPGRTFQEVMGELTGTPLEKSLEMLKIQCLKLDHEVAHDERHWLTNARELSDVATAMARERYQLDVCDPSNDSPNGVVINRDFEVLVYTWTARLKTFDHQLDEMEVQYS